MIKLQLNECQNIIGYTFSDQSYLDRALTHSSAKTPTMRSNERQEFLGDAILGLCISEYLFKTFSTFDEGELTKIKSVVVSSSTLAAEVERMGLAQFIRMGKGIGTRGSVPKSILADLFEAIVAAIFLDGGLEEARTFVLSSLVKHIDTVLDDKHPKNYKSLLQQFSQRELLATPVYQVVREDGPDHIKTFEVVAIVRGKRFKPAVGNSKKEAEQRAAREALTDLQTSVLEQEERVG